MNYQSGFNKTSQNTFAYKLVAIIILLFNIYAAGWGQTLKGKVIDKSSKYPLEEVYLINKASGNHAHSNAQGIFLLYGTHSGDTVITRYFGYKSDTLVITEDNIIKGINITLAQSILLLDEIQLTTDLNASDQVAEIDVRVTPVNSSQEVLRKVPGLFIGQHAGGGKAEQIFLRGFDIDHGTDIAITVDGLPVNMVSHAHGQGYADLHFLIPETIDKINFGKGPYTVEKGNFATAGHVDFKSKDRLEKSSASFEYGMFNTKRTVGLIDLTDKDEKNSAYVAGEYLLTDGYFVSPQNFNRLNLMAKYSGFINENQKLTVMASHFRSKWDASGQIPERAVSAGLISRFGAIDDTEGGNTGRTNLALTHTNFVDENTFIKTNAYLSRYHFELFSNFTFFLEDTTNGDQIKQKETRTIAGIESVFNKTISRNSWEYHYKFGTGFRYDDIDNVELSNTANRKTTLNNLSLGDIDETNLFAFTSLELSHHKWLFNPSLRIDYFRFDYVNKLDTAYNNNSEGKAVLSPKLNIVYSVKNNLQLYLKNGIGFHSNDTRVVVAREGHQILPMAFGSDLGTIWKPFRRLIVNSALWQLYLQQEFVYVGDAAIVEPSGRTQRIGIDFGLRYQLTKWLFLDGDINYAHGRSLDDPKVENYIPLAPNLTSTGGLSVQHPSGIAGGIRYRYLKDRPANEDNSIIASGYFVTDANINYTWKNFNLGLIAENIFNTQWNETQFATESRLRFEQNSVEEIHFTPGIPFYIKARIGVSF